MGRDFYWDFAQAVQERQINPPAFALLRHPPKTWEGYDVST